MDWGCCEQAHKGFAGRVCPPAPRQAHDVPHQILALLRSSLPAFRGRWQAGSPHSARRRLLEAAGDRRAAVARLERAAAVAPAQIRPAILTELAAMKAAGAP